MDGETAGDANAGRIEARWSERARRWGPPSGTAPADDARINFDQGLPDPSHFPVEELRRCLDETLTEDGDQALRSWIHRLGDDAYVYFNNDPGGAAVRDAVRFAALARKEGRDVSRTPAPLAPA